MANARITAASAAVTTRPWEVRRGRSLRGKSIWRPRVYAVMAPTNADPAGCGVPAQTIRRAAKPRPRARVDSSSWVGIRRAPRRRSEDHRPQREAVGRPAQQPPKKQPRRPIVMASSNPGALASSNPPSGSFAGLALHADAPPGEADTHHVRVTLGCSIEPVGETQGMGLHVVQGLAPESDDLQRPCLGPLTPPPPGSPGVTVGPPDAGGRAGTPSLTGPEWAWPPRPLCLRP